MVKAIEILVEKAKTAIPLKVVSKAGLAGLGKAVKAQAAALGFEAAPLALMPVIENGELTQVLVGEPVADTDPFALGAISSKLPEGTYAFSSTPREAHLAALGFALDLYRHDPFRPAPWRGRWRAAPSFAP